MDIILNENTLFRHQSILTFKKCSLILLVKQKPAEYCCNDGSGHVFRFLLLNAGFTEILLGPIYILLFCTYLLLTPF